MKKSIAGHMGKHFIVGQMTCREVQTKLHSLSLSCPVMSWTAVLDCCLQKHYVPGGQADQELCPVNCEASQTQFQELVCDLEAKTSQNYCFFYTNAQIGSIRSCSNGLKFGMNIGLYMGQILG